MSNDSLDKEIEAALDGGDRVGRRCFVTSVPYPVIAALTQYPIADAIEQEMP